LSVAEAFGHCRSNAVLMTCASGPATALSWSGVFSPEMSVTLTLQND